MMALDVFLGELTTLGIRLMVNGDRLRVEAPGGTVTPELRERLAAAKPELIAKLQAEAPAPEATPEPAPPVPHPGLGPILSMPLKEFGRRNLALRIKLPDGSQCWFVSGAAEVQALRSEGVERGAIWTAQELADVVGAGWTRETIGRLIAVKRTFGGAAVASTPPPGEVPAAGAGGAIPSPTCSCGGRRFWRSRQGATVCARCHPPAAPELVAEWIEDGDGPRPA